MTSPVRLTSLTLRNFKAIGDEPQTITFAPITLLFGPNSAGKSTIIHALHYAREILCHRNLDPHHILDDALDLGGFRSLVHDHDLDTVIQLTLGFALSGEPPTPEWWTDLDWMEDEDRLNAITDVIAKIRDFAVKMEIRWSETRARPYVSRYRTVINNETFAAMQSSPDSRRIEVYELNTRHRLLFGLEQPLWQEGCASEDIEQVIAESNALSSGELLPIVVEADSDDDALPKWQKRLKLSLRGPSSHDYSIKLKEQMALVRQFKKGEADEKDLDEQIQCLFHYNILEISSELIAIGLAWPAGVASQAISDWLHIGPLREVPPRSFVGRQHTLPSRWINGRAAWDVLSHADDSLVNEVNSWLANEYRLNTGYRLRVARYREIPFRDPLWRILEGGCNLEEVFADEDDFYRHLNALPTQTRLFFLREGSNTDLSPADVGVGLSQLIPVIVSCVSASGPLIAIEQPELHNHPAIQVALGDLFIQAALHQQETLPEEQETLPEKEETGFVIRLEGDWEVEPPEAAPAQERTPPILLIETHSEHLILRLLRRIRETADGELPPGAPALKPDDIAVHYVEPTSEGVRIKHLRVNEEGDFLDRWPRGFFEERAKELF